MPWTLEQTQHLNCANRSERHGVQVEAHLDEDSLDLSAEQGSGYCRESVNFSIPVSVLKSLLEHVGFVVERREATEDRGPSASSTKNSEDRLTGEAYEGRITYQKQ